MKRRERREGEAYIKTIIITEDELELGGEVAKSTTEDTEKNSGSWQKISSLANVWAQRKMIMGLRDPTKPEAGVIATSPEIAPEQNPTALHFFSIL